MKKTILYRLFRIGAVPRQLLPLLEQEGIIVLDEGIGGWFIAKHVHGPGRFYRYRSEGFSGFLAVTNERVICYTYYKRQINIAVNDPKIRHLYVDLLTDRKLSISFESSNFREGWNGVVVFRFNTDKAALFRDTLLALGVQQGVAADV